VIDCIIKPLNGWVVVKIPTDNMYQGKAKLYLARADGVRSLRGTVVAVSEDAAEVAIGDEVWYQVGSAHKGQTGGIPLPGHEDFAVLPISRDVSLVEALNRMDRLKAAGIDVTETERALYDVSQHRGDVVWKTGRRGMGIFAKQVGEDIVPLERHSLIQLPEKDYSLDQSGQKHPTLLRTTDPALVDCIGKQVVVVLNAGCVVGNGSSDLVIVKNEEILAVED